MRVMGHITSESVASQAHSKRYEKSAGKVVLGVNTGSMAVYISAIAFQRYDRTDTELSRQYSENETS